MTAVSGARGARGLPQPSDTALSEEAIQRRVGGRIRDLRVALGLTATDLAARAGISQGQLSKIETGKATLSIRTLARLCEVLDRPLSYLFQSEREAPRMLGVVGTLHTVEGPESRGVRGFADEVARRTGGRLSLMPLRASQLGSASEQVRQLRDGLIDVFVEDLALYERIAPALRFLALPGTFADDGHLARFLAAPLVAEGARAALRAEGIHLLNARWNWRRGVESVLASRRPIFEPEDLAGLRTRVQDIPVLGAFWREMGAEPVVVPWADVKGALERGEVDAVSTHRAHLWPLGFCEHARYVTCLDDVRPVLAVAMNAVKFQALPPDVQSAVIEACDAAGDAFTEMVTRAEDENERLNAARYRAAYIRVALEPWRVRVAEARGRLLERGELPREVWSEIEALRRAPARDTEP